MLTPLAYTVTEACRVAGVGRTTLYEAIKSGKLIARKLGRRTLILAEDLAAWLKTLPRLNTDDRGHGSDDPSHADPAAGLPTASPGTNSRESKVAWPNANIAIVSGAPDIKEATEAKPIGPIARPTVPTPNGEPQ